MIAGEMTVRRLLEETPHSAVLGPVDRPVTGITCDSREVVPSGLFAALDGMKRDGREFVHDAVQRGATAVLSHAGPAGDMPEGVTWVIASRDRQSFSAACAAFYGTPSMKTKVAGITGTNGKTTTVYLLERIFSRVGESGMLSTVEYRTGGVATSAARTTPEAHQIHSFLRDLDERNAPFAAMEVSSHAIDLHRVSHVPFSVAAFTNLTRDHMDYHGSMEEYFRVKRRLFDLLAPGGTAVIDREDSYGARLHKELKGIGRLSVGKGRREDVHAVSCRMDFGGIRMEVATPAGRVGIESSLTGEFNRRNLLMAVGCATALGIPLGEIAAGIGSLSTVPGRMERVGDRQPFTVFVDYAHTDDALRNLLETVRRITQGRLVTVFGCGGDRDRTKRPLMGAVSARLSDVVILTSDNPRTEDPERILDDVEAGIRPELDGTKEYRRVADRREAILLALRTAGGRDVVVVAGKGHEEGQDLGTKKIPFHDPTVVTEALEELGW